MNLTAEQLQIASMIDAEMQKLVCDGNDDLTILGEMFDYMPGFKRLMDTAEPGTIDELCRRFAGTISCCSRLLVGNFSTGKQPEE